MGIGELGGLIEDTHAETEKGLVFIQYICHAFTGKENKIVKTMRKFDSRKQRK